MALVLGAVPTLASWCCFSGWDFKKSSWKDEEIGPGHCWGGKSGPLVSGVLTWNPPNPAKVAVSVWGGWGPKQEGEDEGRQARGRVPSRSLKVGQYATSTGALSSMEGGCWE